MIIRKTSLIALFLVTLCACAFVISPAAAADNSLNGKFRTPVGANLPPTVSSVQPTGTSSQVTCTPGGTTNFPIIVRVSDPNGNADIKQISVQLSRRWYGDMNFGNPIVVTQGSVIPGDINAKEYTVNVPFEYYWPATSVGAGETQPPFYYTATVTASDQSGATATGTLTNIEYLDAIGFAIDTPTAPSGSLPTLDFGEVNYGQSADQSSTMHNTANTPLGITVGATPWHPAGTSYPDVQVTGLSTMSGTTPIPVNAGTRVTTLTKYDESPVDPPTPTSLVFRYQSTSSIIKQPNTEYSTTITLTGSRI